MNNEVVCKILFPYDYSEARALSVEHSLQDLLFNDTSPLRRCMKDEVSFVTIPFPRSDPETGRLIIYGPFDEGVARLFPFSPYFSLKKGIPTISSPGLDLVPVFETAFLSYLTSFRCKRRRSLTPPGKTYLSRIDRAKAMSERYQELFSDESFLTVSESF